MKTVLLVVLMFIVSTFGRPLYEPEPEFCNGLECPHFTVKKNTSEYQIRCYQAYKWMSTNVADYTYKEAVGIGFMRLFNYIDGKNNESKKIPMTAPVLVQIQPAQGPYCKNNFTVSFFIPFDLQAHPIPATEKDIYVTSYPAICAYVRTYPGFGSNTDDILKNAEELTEVLSNEKLSDTYHKDFYFYAGYDSPFQLFHRHNDILFIMK